MILNKFKRNNNQPNSLNIPKRQIILGKNVKKPKRSTKSRIALWSLSTVAILSFLLLILPYLPQLAFWIHRPKLDTTIYQKAAEDSKAGNVEVADPKRPGNRLALPSIGVDTQIIDGANLYVIGKNQGVWRESRGNDPTKDGNIVIAGHRFLYTAKNGGWFYNLPEIKTGDSIFIKWSNKTYEYQVYDTRTVSPTQVDIRDNDPKVKRKLTLYTCYPLGSTAKRFVVEAKQL